MVENYQNSDINNKNSSIEIKKTLKRTILQLEKAINIINQKSIKDLPSLKVVETLLNSSNSLVDYLQFRSSQVDNEENLVQKTINNNDEDSEINKNQYTVNKKRNIALKKDKKNSMNLILAIALIISLFSNLLIWWFKPNIAVNLSKNSDNNSQIEYQESQENKIIIENPPIIDNKNISTKENNEIDNILLNDSNSLEIINDKIEENIIENEFQSEDKIKENNNNIDNDNIDNIKENSLEESLSLPSTPEQSLLQNIETQIADITNKYQKKLIIKIEANFSNNSLIITLSQDWYSLNNSQQNNLVKDIFNKVKTLNFYKFNIQDLNGKLLARNAVVGSDFIIIN